jgi:hypothetical protein
MLQGGRLLGGRNDSNSLQNYCYAMIKRYATRARCEGARAHHFLPSIRAGLPLSISN